MIIFDISKSLTYCTRGWPHSTNRKNNYFMSGETPY